MNDQSDRRRSWLAIPILIAAVAVVIALGAIVMALHSSPSEPMSAAKTPAASLPTVAPSLTPAAAAPVLGPNDQQPRITKSLRVPLRAAQDALKSRNYLDAIAKLESADSSQEKSRYDQHVINVLLSGAYAGIKDYGATARVVEAELNDGFLTPSQTEKETAVAALLNYQIKNYDKAIEFGSRAVRSMSANPQIPTMVGQAYYLKGDWAGTARFIADSVNRQIAAGGTPDGLSLELWKSACLKLQDNSCERQALDKLLAYHPTPETQRELDRLQAAR